MLGLYFFPLSLFVVNLITMKKIFILSTLFLVIVLYSKLREKDNHDDFSSDRFESYTQNENKNEKVKAKTQIPVEESKSSPKRINKLKATNVAQESNQKVLLSDDIHSAQVDHEGKIYPRNVTVDEDMIVAYGDLIVGSTDDLDDYQSGEKILSIPPPSLWPNGSIPYEFDDSLDDPIQIEIIKKVTNQLNELASIHFHPRKASEEHYVLFKRGAQHCYANVGFRFGVTLVSLSSRCGEKEINHELFHVLGFYHEQNRPDRDDYIEVLWENIDEENWAQFEKFAIESYPTNLQDTENNPFEFSTIMLYDSRAFSNTSDFSMVKVDGTDFSSPFTSPTPTDVGRLKKLYPTEK